MTAVAIAAVLVGAAVLLWPAHSPDARLVHRWAGPAQPSSADPTLSEATDALEGSAALTVAEVASSMTLLALATRSGAGVVEAVEEVASVIGGRAGRDLRSVAAALRWGIPEREAWGSVGPAWSRTGTALRLAAQAGAAPSPLLLAGAADLRADELGRLDVRAGAVGVRMVLPLGLTFLPAFTLTTIVPVVLALAAQVFTA